MVTERFLHCYTDCESEINIGKKAISEPGHGDLISPVTLNWLAMLDTSIGLQLSALPHHPLFHNQYATLLYSWKPVLL